MLLPWFNCPLWFLPVQWGASSALQLRNAIMKGYFWSAFTGLAAGYGAVLGVGGGGQWGARKPLPWSVYKLFRQMRARGGSRLSEIEGLLPARSEVGAPSAKLMAEVGVAGA